MGSSTLKLIFLSLIDNKCEIVSKNMVDYPNIIIAISNIMHLYYVGQNLLLMKANGRWHFIVLQTAVRIWVSVTDGKSGKRNQAKG